MQTMSLLTAYKEPKTKDMAVCIIHFNATESVRLVQNFLLVWNSLKRSHIPCFVLELCFGNQVPIISGSTVVVRADTVTFQKENLCRILERHVPDTYTKLLFMDADIFFQDPGWYSTTSTMLDVHDVVQPFKRARWLDLTYTRVIKRSLSVVMNSSKSYDARKYHPGFAWGFRREWYREFGFFDHSVIGGGDACSVLAWKGFSMDRVPPALRPAHLEFRDTLLQTKYSIGHTQDTVYHLWHGYRENRGYTTRQAILEDVEDIRDIIKKNKDGVYEIPEFSEAIKSYLSSRKDDEVSCPQPTSPKPWPYLIPAAVAAAGTIGFFCWKYLMNV